MGDIPTERQPIRTQAEPLAIDGAPEALGAAPQLVLAPIDSEQPSRPAEPAAEVIVHVSTSAGTSGRQAARTARLESTEPNRSSGSHWGPEVTTSKVHRRSFLERLGLGAGATILSPLVSGLISEAQGATPARRRFIYFQYDRAPNVFKDDRKYAFHKASELVNDTERFVRELMVAGGDFVGGLLTAPWGVARKATMQSYNLTGTVADQPARLDFPVGQRSGMLTQPSFLVAFSAAEENNPVTRGKFIAQHLLCKSLPDSPPGDVPPLPKTANQTLRQKLALHFAAGSSCPACHRMMDPLGLGLEGYDHVGRHRTMEEGKPVETSGELTGAGTGDGPFKDAADLARRLAASQVVRQCFVLNGLRYWLGREEATGDACTLTAAFEASKGGADAAAMVVALLTSPSFMYRTAEPGR